MMSVEGILESWGDSDGYVSAFVDASEKAFSFDINESAERNNLFADDVLVSLLDVNRGLPQIHPIWTSYKRVGDCLVNSPDNSIVVRAFLDLFNEGVCKPAPHFFVPDGDGGLSRMKDIRLSLKSSVVHSVNVLSELKDVIRDFLLRYFDSYIKARPDGFIYVYRAHAFREFDLKWGKDLYRVEIRCGFAGFCG